MNVIGACLSLDDLYFHLLAQFFDDFDDVPTQRLVNYFPPVLRRKYQVIFAPIAGMCRMLYLIFHLRKTSLFFRDAVAKPSRLLHGGFICQGFFIYPWLNQGFLLSLKAINKKGFGNIPKAFCFRFLAAPLSSPTGRPTRFFSSAAYFFPKSF